MRYFLFKDSVSVRYFLFTDTLSVNNFFQFFLAFWGKKIGYFDDWGQVLIVFGSTHIKKQLLFSLFPSILTFDFDLILGLFFTFSGPNGLFVGAMWGLKTVVGF